MSTPSFIFKLVVSGPFSAGKTTFIETVVQRDFVTLDARTSSGDESSVKQATTVGLDFGALTVDDGEGGIELRIYGTPGQERFRFMWEVLAEGADAYILLLDGLHPDTWELVRGHHEVLQASGVPGVLAVNRGGADVAQLAAERFADLDLPVLRCDATNEDEVLGVVIEALMAILDVLEGPAAEGPVADGPTGDVPLVEVGP